MSDTLVWAFKPLKELNYETGLVQCDEELAAQLIAAGDAQDTRDGALHFKEVEHTPQKHDDTYETKVVTARKSRAIKAESEDSV